MKNFTKVFLAASVVLGMSGVSFAQYDVTTNIVNSPANGATINTVLETPFDIRFTNNGPGTIPASTEVNIVVYVNGSAIGAPIGPYTIPTAGMAMGTDLGFPPSPAIRFNVPPNSGTIRVCYSCVVTGNADPNPANDTAGCVTYNVDPGTTVDLSMSDLKIVVPNIPAGGKVGANGVQVVEMAVTITNEGDFTYPAGTVIPYSLEVEGETPNSVTGQLSAALAPNASTTRQITNANVIPALPSSGPFRMCATAMITNDVDANNNKTCTDYVSSVGIEDVKSGNALSAVYFNQSANVLSVFLAQSIKGKVNMTITSTGGQTIKNVEFMANGQQKEEVELNGISNGLYILTISTENGEVETQKFVVN